MNSAPSMGKATPAKDMKQGFEMFMDLELTAQQIEAANKAANKAKFKAVFSDLCVKMCREYLSTMATDENEIDVNLNRFKDETKNGALLIERVSGETSNLIAFHFEDGKQFTTREFYPYTVNMCVRVVSSWCEKEENILDSLANKFRERNKAIIRQIGKIKDSIETLESLGMDTEALHERIKELMAQLR